MTEIMITPKTPIGIRKKYFSATTGGLYIQGIGTAPLPDDAIEISNTEWIALLRFQSAGRHIIAGPDGKPIPAPAPAVAPAPESITAPKKFYSAKTLGFYAEEIHGADMPSDAVEVTHDEWQALLNAQSDGKQIVPGPGGKPIATDRIASAADVRAEHLAKIERLKTSVETLDAQRGALLGKPGAKEKLLTIDNQIAALVATLPPDPAATTGVTS